MRVDAQLFFLLEIILLIMPLALQKSTAYQTEALQSGATDARAMCTEIIHHINGIWTLGPFTFPVDNAPLVRSGVDHSKRD